MIHLLFDLLAWSSSAAAGYWVRRHWLADHGSPRLHHHPAYFACAVLGAALGAFGLGTLNLLLSGVDGLGRSVLGGLGGAILGVEIYKAARDHKGSTGTGFVAPLAVGIAVGRMGCLLSGLDDMTHGTVTALPWGWDFGDGLRRHPVQFYESLAMLAFLAWFLPALARRSPLALHHGFHVFAGVYATQRFAWEFLKPYGTVLGPFNVFHLACLALAGYACWMIFARRSFHAS